jgi:predicted SAM-dependent methyltransferase
MRSLLLFIFSHRLLAIARWDLHFVVVRFRNLLTRQKAKANCSVARRTRPVFLNLGSGPRGRRDEHWINVDGYKDLNVDFLFDFARRLPFSARSFDGVFCEHVLEHFSLSDGENIAREVNRILVPGGCFRIIVPDAELILKCYFEAPEKLIAWRHDGETAMEVVNSYFRQRYEHQFLYDWATMRLMLSRAGFTEIRRSTYGTTTAFGMALDDPKYSWESLYVEAFAGGS